MKKLLVAAFLLLASAAAQAADNAVLFTPCSSGCTTFKSKDVGSGVQAMQPILSDTTGTPIGVTGNALDINVKSGGGVSQGSTTSGQVGSLIQGAVTTAAPSYTTLQTSPLSMDRAGYLRAFVAPATPATPVAAAASDNHAVLANGAGVAYSVHASNNSATRNYLRLYDAGTGFNGCNSATNVIFAMEIPPNDSGFSVALGGGVGIAFANGLSWCITSGFGLTDTTNATASAIYANASYRLTP